MVNRQDVRRNKKISNDEILKDIIAARQVIRVLRSKKSGSIEENQHKILQIQQLKENINFLQDLLLARTKNK